MCAVLTFHTPLGLRGIRGNQRDPQLRAHPPKLGHRLFPPQPLPAFAERLYKFFQSTYRVIGTPLHCPRGTNFRVNRQEAEILKSLVGSHMAAPLVRNVAGSEKRIVFAEE